MASLRSQTCHFRYHPAPRHTIPSDQAQKERVDVTILSILRCKQLHTPSRCRRQLPDIEIKVSVPPTYINVKFPTNI